MAARPYLLFCPGPILDLLRASLRKPEAVFVPPEVDCGIFRLAEGRSAC